MVFLQYYIYCKYIIVFPSSTELFKTRCTIEMSLPSTLNTMVSQTLMSSFLWFGRNSRSLRWKAGCMESDNTTTNNALKFWSLLRNSWDILEKFLRNSWEIPEKFLRNSWDIPEKFLRNSWDIPEKFLRNSWEIRDL